jgi:N utilization substance protein B
MKRRVAREKALQALFQIDLSDIETEDAMRHALDGEESDAFFENLVHGVVEHQTEIDQLISKHLVNWKLERIANVDRVILRTAVYELLYLEDIPASVTINEAIELAKSFGDDHAAKFINGVLSSIHSELQ